MQDDSQAFHAQRKALLQSVALSFAASKHSRYRQIPHMAGYPASMNTPHTGSFLIYCFLLQPILRTPQSYRVLPIRLSKQIDFKSAQRSQEIRTGHLPATVTIQGCPFFKLPFQPDHKGEKARRPKRVLFLFAMTVLQIHGFQVRAGCTGLLLLPCCCFSFFFPPPFWGWTEKGLQFIRPEREWSGEVSGDILTTPSAGKVSQHPALLTLLSQDQPWVGL